MGPKANATIGGWHLRRPAAILRPRGSCGRGAGKAGPYHGERRPDQGECGERPQAPGEGRRIPKEIGEMLLLSVNSTGNCHRNLCRHSGYQDEVMVSCLFRYHDMTEQK